MTKKRGCLLIILALFFLFLIFLTLQFRIGGPEELVSKETTILTAPLRDDGTVDYAKAWNDERIAAVPPESNAAVMLLPFCRELTENADMKPYSLTFADVLGVDELPAYQPIESPRYAIQQRWETTAPEGMLTDEQSLILDKLEKGTTTRPWSAEEFPQAAAIVRGQEEQYKTIIEASKLPNYFHPIIAGEVEGRSAGLITALLPMTQSMRHFVRSLNERAMLQLGEGDTEGAIESIQAMRRLGLLSCQSTTLIEKLVANAIFGITFAAEEQLLKSGQLSTKQLADYRQFLKDNPYPDDFAERIGKHERYFVLDAIQLINLYGVDSLQEIAPMFGGGGGGGEPSALGNFALRSIDMREVMLRLNEYYDETEKLLSEKSLRKRQEIAAQMEERLVQMEIQATKPWKALLGRRARAEYAANIMLALAAPAMMQVQQSDFRVMIQDAVIEAAFAIEQFKSERGEYPDKLEDLVPGFYDASPIDPFTESSLNYKKTADGMMVYSIGTDGADNGGMVWNEMTGGNFLTGDIRYLAGTKPTPQLDSPLDNERRAQESQQRELEREQKRAEKRKLKNDKAVKEKTSDPNQ